MSLRFLDFIGEMWISCKFKHVSHSVKTVVKHSCATVWSIKKYSKETEAAQSGRMYFFLFLFLFYFGRILPMSASSCLSALMISHIQY